MDRRSLLAGLAALALPGGAGAAAPARKLTLLAFGDSLTAGFGLAPGQGFVPALRRWLKAQDAPPVRMVNGGLSGDTTYGGRVRIGWALRGSDPDAVLVELGANDMLLGFDADHAARNLDAILTAAKAGGRPVLLMGIGAVGRDRAFRDRWDAMWPAVAARNGVPLVPDLYATIRVQPRRTQRAWLQADHLHASPKGVDSMVALAGPAVLALLREAAAKG